MRRVQPFGITDRISGSWRTFVVPAGGTCGREVCASCFVLGFFPDAGFALTRNSAGDFEKMTLQSGKTTPVLAAGQINVLDVSLSPDGEWLALLAGEPDGQVAIRIVPIAGGQGAGENPIPVAQDSRYLSAPAWSPNGRYLYYLS